MNDDDRAQLDALGKNLRSFHFDLGANTYQTLAMSTANTLDTPDHRLINAALGFVGEAGEITYPIGEALDGDLLVERVLTLAGYVGKLADHLKKARYHGKAIDFRYFDLLCTAIRQGAELTAITAGHEMISNAPNPAEASLARIDPGLEHELGDMAWYLAQACHSRGWNLADVLRTNINKLRARWPEGFQRADEHEA